MRPKPDFFDDVKQRAAQDRQLREGNQEYAGVCKQFFLQVQSPRHVLSELLQNADDAGATEASVWIENETFIFEHNGNDFSKEDFDSLCRFCCSNKRALHTIGFRGIGFKSTFSLGDPVKLFTPSLSVCFHKHRFTEPHWLPEEVDTLGKTRLVVKISDQNRQQEVEKNLQEWSENAISLLFFNNIREIKICEQRLRWDSRPGPIPNSKWMIPNEDEHKAHLLIHSDAEDFPSEALEEIRQEKTLASNEEFKPLQCKIEIVLEVEVTGYLYVVLPIDVATGLPFTCNAPFIQDPARLKIKDLGTSPTNRWLLQRAGKLAASAMLDWLNTDVDIVERAKAYDLLPNINRDNNSLGGVCGTSVQDAFQSEIQDKYILLTDNNFLNLPKESIAIPEELFEIWPPDVATKVLDEGARPALCRHITKANRKKLVAQDLLEELSDAAVIKMLETKSFPKPNTWPELLNLWAYILPKVKNHHYHGNPKNIHIVPVQGKDVLCASKEIIRLGKNKLLQSQTDQEFLNNHLSSVLDKRYLTYLEELKENKNDESTNKRILVANEILNTIGLESASPVDKVIEFAADKLFSQENVSYKEFVQIAQIAAKLNANITKFSSKFEYVTRDTYRRSSKEEKFILFDKDDMLEELLPDNWRETKLLHDDYSKSFESCSQDEWQTWITSGHAGLSTFIPLIEVEESVDRIEEEAKKHDLNCDQLEYKYVYSNYKLKSLDFDEACWEYWTKLAGDDPKLWIKLIRSILINSEKYLDKCRNTNLFHISTHKDRTEYKMNNKRSWLSRTSSGTSSWLVKLRELRCLPNREGVPCKPGDLFVLTHETALLSGVEDFVEKSLDNERTRPLLDLMGVRKTPGRPDRLLHRLQELSQAAELSVDEVDKLYGHLDRMLSQCSTEDSNKIKQAFQSERLILTENNGWQMPSDVFLTPGEENIPDIKIIRNTVNSLEMLWSHVGVAEKPTLSDVVRWLKRLPENSVLNENDRRYMYSVLSKYPDYIWKECQQWCNFAGEWTSVDHLSWSLTSHSPVFREEDLYPWAKKRTADLKFLSQEVDDSTFSHLPNLATTVKPRLDEDNLECDDSAELEEWLTMLGSQLCRVKLSTNGYTQRIRELAERLAQTKPHKMQVLKTVPYIDDQCAGDPRQRDVLWCNNDLFYRNLPEAKLAKLIPEEIGREFELQDIKAALDYSFRRSAQDVQKYVEANFKLCPACDVSEKTAEEPRPTFDSGSRKELNEVGGGQDAIVLKDDDDVHNTDPAVVDSEQDTDANIEEGKGRHRRFPQVSQETLPGSSPRKRNSQPARIRILSDNQVIAERARKIIMDVEHWLGFEPVDKESERNLGYDIESRVPGTEHEQLRLIEVKGRSADSLMPTITVTRNEIICSLDNPDKFIFVIVEFDRSISDNCCQVKVYYLRKPFRCKSDCKPDSDVVSVNYGFGKLLEGMNRQDAERITFDHTIVLKEELDGELIDRTYHCKLKLSCRDLD